jgi:CubicO group peptidase (beta-lactamase class C family)
VGESVLPFRPGRAAAEASRSRWPAATIALGALTGFVGVTASVGAVFVVPALPIGLYRSETLQGPAAPAVELGLVAALSLAALYGVVTRRRFTAPLSILAGAALVFFELIQSFAVGSVFTPPVGATAIGYVAIWSQPVFISVGVAVVVLGGRLRLSRGKKSRPRVFQFAAFPANAVAIALVLVTVAFASFYGWAAASTGTSMYARVLVWGTSTTYDWSRYPSRPLPAAASPDQFVQAPERFDLAKATGSTNPDQFFSSSETTALLVVQHDKLVLERYFNGADRTTMITAFSGTKSWDSAMVGAAIAAGYIHSVDDPVTAYIPELARKDSRFTSITIRDLLDMRSGLALDTTSFILNDNTVIDHTTDLRQAVLDRVRIATTPGTTFRYNDFNPELIGMVLERVTGMSVTQWLDQTLWQPMGAQYPGSFSIDSTAAGFEKMERGLNGTAIDLVRLGLLYLHNGDWNGAQLVPSAWVAASTSYATAGPVPRFPGLSYGLGWWTRVIDGVEVYYAWGDHGEYVLVAPSLDVVVARFGRQFGLGEPLGDSSGGNVGVQVWPQVLTRIATTAAATSGLGSA